MIQVVRGERRTTPAPPPAEMMPRASPRLLVNHFVAVAESGVRKAPAAKPTPRPNVRCRCQSAVAWLDSTRLRPSKRPPAIVTERLPRRSDIPPPKNDPTPPATQFKRAGPHTPPRPHSLEAPGALRN